MMAKKTNKEAKGRRLGISTVLPAIKEDFCHRCMWIKVNLKLPWQIFPSIFSRIDSYTKKVVHANIDKSGELRLPAGLSKYFPNVREYVKPPHWLKFKCDIGDGFELSGVADAIWETEQKTLIIPDFKTSIYDPLSEFNIIYRTQLNLYKMIAEKTGMGVVDRLALIYMEPVLELLDTEYEDMTDFALIDHDVEGFVLAFRYNVVKVDIMEQSIIDDMLERVKVVVSKDEMPYSSKDCDDCKKLNMIVKEYCHSETTTF